MALKDLLLGLGLPVLLAAKLYAGEDMAPSANQFAWTAYRDLAQAKGNLIFSPFSIATALSMLLPGARGKTSSEISAVLHQMPLESLAARIQELEKSGNGAGNQLKIANGLWVQRGFGILPAFQNTLAQQFGAPLHEVDFEHQAEEARARVNSWTERQTNSRIRELFGPGSLDRQTRLVLTSAIYFYGKWQAPFDAKQTHPAPFRAAGGAVQADFMNRSGPYSYAETADRQILEIGYAGTGLAFDVLLPKSDDGLHAVESTISSDDFAKAMAMLRRRTVQVSLPKFRAESGFSLKAMLSRMGMADSFTGLADFSGIDGRRDLAISDVKHKAFVDVSEEGTEAAAATGIGMVLASMPAQPPVIFRADHPFLFVIRDTRSGLILFAGRVMNPKS
jgi:serpin B